MIEKIEKFGEKWYGMVILIAIPVFIVLLPVLSGHYNFIDAESDRFQQDFYFYKDAILIGDSFFWNPYLLSGFPKFASLTGGYFNPFVYLGLKFFSVPFVYNWLNFFYIVLAAFFAALFLKKININFWGCLIGGWIFVFSQWARNHDITMNSALFLLPLLFLMILEIREKKRRKTILSVLAGALAIGFAWLSSFWHFLVEILFASGFFSLFFVLVDFTQDKKTMEKDILSVLKINLKKYTRVPFAYSLMVLGGAIVGLIQLVPTLFFITLSVRTEQFSHWKAVLGGIHFYDFIALFLPFFNYPFLARSAILVEYWSILPLFFLFVIFSFSGLRMSSFFSFLFTISMILAVNGSPLFWAIHHLPGFSLLQVSSRWMLLVSFSASVLVALGLNAFLEKFEEFKDSRRLKIALRLSGWIIAIFVFISFVFSVSYYFFKEKILFLLNYYFDKFVYLKTAQLSHGYYYGYINRLFSDFMLSFSPLNLKFLFPVVFLIAGYFFIKFYIAGKFQQPRNFAALAAAMIALNFIFVYIFNDNIYKDYTLDKEPETVKFLRNKEPGRVFSFFRNTASIKLENYGAYGTKKEEAELRAELLFPNRNLPFKIESPDIEGDPMANQSMSKLITLIGAAASLPNSQTIENMSLPIEEKIKIFESRKPIIDFLNIRYLLSSVEISNDVFPKIFETKATSKNINVFIYENKNARPLYYFTDENWLIDIDKGTSPENFNEKLSESKGKITQEGIRLVERKNAKLVLETDSVKERLLVFSQNNLPGWKLSVDGVKIPIYNAGTVYMGAKIPIGRHRVCFEYSYWEIWRQFFNAIF